MHTAKIAARSGGASCAPGGQVSGGSNDVRQGDLTVTVIDK